MSSRQRWTLAAVCMGTFMLLLDITVVNVALPDIRKSLGASFSDLQWVVDAYALALLAAEFQGRERGAAFGAWGATIGFAVAIGPLVGGALTDGFGWEWIFFVNIPVGIATMVVATLRVHDSRNPEGGGVDWLGVLTFSGSLFLLVFGLIRANDLGWGSTAIVLRF